MGRRSGPTELAELRRHWSRWTEIVEGHARRRRGRRRLDPEEYAALHHGLMASCRALAGAADEKGRSLYQGLEGLARPWASPRVLEQADRDILFDLCARCRQAERDLGCPARLRALLHWVPRLALPAAAAVALALLIGSTERFWLPAASRLDGWWRASWFVLRRSVDTQWLIVGGVVIILIAMYMVARDVRR